VTDLCESDHGATIKAKDYAMTVSLYLAKHQILSKNLISKTQRIKNKNIKLL